MRLVVIWLVTFLIILVSLGVVVGLEYAQVTIAKLPLFQQNGATITTVFNYIISVCLMVVNKLLWVVLFYLIKIEFNHTSSEEVTSRVNKAIIAQSLNCIVVPIITNISLQSKFYGPDGLTGQNSRLLHRQRDTSACTSNLRSHIPFEGASTESALSSLAKYAPLNTVIRYMWKQEIKNDDELSIKFITKVNKLYEGSDFDITSSYVYLLANLLHASFYCTLQPFLLVLSGVGFFLFYYIKKYLLLTRYNEPGMLNKLVFSNAVSALCYVPIFYGVGGIVFLTYIYSSRIDLIVPNAVAILLGVLNIFNPGRIFDKPVEYFYKLATKKTVSKREVAP
ncbi:unnamed protein product [Sphagnum balticum]